MEKGKRTILIFPPLRLGRPMLERVSFLFGTPTICLPWQMKPPFENGGATDQGSFDIVRPPRDMMPPEYFPRLLAEYRTWMKDHSGRGGSAFLAATRELYPHEDTRWEIQRMVRTGADGDGDTRSAQALALKQHLLLHLAAASEKEAGEAEETLRRLKDQGSPLREALGEETDVPDLMYDLSPSLLQPVIEHDLLEDVCESWLGLFGELIQKESTLITFDEEIQHFLSALFEEAISQVRLIHPLPKASFLIGDPLSFSSRETSPLGQGSLQKRAMSITNDLVKQLREKAEDQGEVAALISSFQEIFPVRNDSDSICVEMFALPTIKGPHPSQRQTILNGLSGKTLVFLKADSKNGW